MSRLNGASPSGGCRPLRPGDAWTCDHILAVINGGPNRESMFWLKPKVKPRQLPPVAARGAPVARGPHPFQKQITHSITRHLHRSLKGVLWGDGISRVRSLG